MCETASVGGQEYYSVMKPYAQEAENLRLLLEANIVSIDEVVAWADQTIITLSEYDDELTEISLGAKVQIGEMLIRLSRVSYGADTLEAVRNLAGRMHRVLLTDRSRASDFIRELNQIWADWLDCNDFADDPESGWPQDFAFMGKLYAETEGLRDPELAVDILMAGAAPFDTATSRSTPTSPPPNQSQSESPAERVKGVSERLRRFFRGGQK